jgi:hypothetical protein
LISANGFIAVIGLILLYRRPQIAKWGVISVLVLALISAFFATRTTLLGRGIKHGLMDGGTKSQANFQR